MFRWKRQSYLTLVSEMLVAASPPLSLLLILLLHWWLLMRVSTESVSRRVWLPSVVFSMPLEGSPMPMDLLVLVQWKEPWSVDQETSDSPPPSVSVLLMDESV